MSHLHENSRLPLVTRPLENSDKLIAEFRKKHRFEDYLVTPSEGKMRLAAKYGPIVVINGSKYQCDAILIEQH